MSPPTEAEQMEALASLIGEDATGDEADALAAAATRLQMIARAQRGGVPWRSIASAMGAENGKVAKRDAHRLARQVQAAMIRADTEGLRP